MIVRNEEKKGGERGIITVIRIADNNSKKNLWRVLEILKAQLRYRVTRRTIQKVRCPCTSGIPYVSGNQGPLK